MNNYNGLLNDVVDFLNTDKVINNGNVISLYDFYKIINYELLELKRKYIDFDLNKELKKSSILNFKSKSNPLVITPCLSSWKITMNEGFAILFEYDYRSYIEFSKSINNSELFFEYSLVKISEEKVKKFVKQNYDMVMKMMYLLDEYSSLVSETNYDNCYRERVNSEIFNITLKIGNANMFTTNNPLKFKIEFNPNYENFDYNNKENNKILRTIDSNCFEILKRIPIDITYISEPFKSIYSKNKEKAKEKQLVIKK